MSSEKATAIVLRVVEFSETSSVVTLFTREFGKVRGLAKGARRPKGPFESALDLLSLVRVVFLRKSSDSLDLLTEAKLSAGFDQQAGSLSNLYAAYYVAELLNELIDDYDAHEGLFDAADATLLALARGERVADALVQFEIVALREVGHLPTLEACANCGGDLNPAGRVSFSQLAGGALCKNCRAGQRQVISLSTPVYHALARLSAGEEPEPLEASTYGELRSVLNHYWTHLLGRPPQTATLVTDDNFVNPPVPNTLSPGMKLQASRALLVALALLFAGGCAIFNPGPEVEYPPLTTEQSEWWQANRQRAKYVKGKGYYVEGTSGFFDHDGHRITSDLGIGAEEDKRGFLARLAPKDVVASARKAVGQGPNEGVAKNALAEGDSLFRQKKYEDALKAYRQAYKRWPDSPLEEEALFKAGESAFFADDYVDAEDEYELLIKKFQSTQFLSQVTERRFSIGRYWEAKDRAHPKFILIPNLTNSTLPRFDTGGHALKVYERIRMDDPIGPRADDAVMATANSYFLKGRWDDADYYYGLMRSEFPKSEHQYQAHLLGLRCKLIRYQGPGYDGSQLDEAEDIATQLLTQFPQELGDERERVVHVRAEVRTQRALREYDMAEFYAKNEYYGAARHYYTKVVNDFPDTKLAEQSRTKMTEFSAEPANPTPTFQWLVDILPASKKSGPQISIPAATSPSSTENVASAGEGKGLK